MYSIFLTLILLVLNFPQNEIDYYPKALEKAFQKILKTENAQMFEIEIDAGITANLNGKFYKILTHPVQGPSKYVYIGRVNSCRAGGCSTVSDSTYNLNSEYFDYFMFIDSAFKVMYVKVYNYAATHGQEITAKGWLKQFIGYDGKQPLYVGKDIDAISGATISVYAISSDIQHKTFLLRQQVSNKPESFNK